MLDSTLRRRKTLLTVISVLACGAGAARADAGHEATAAPAMAMGAAAIPPVGFLDLCVRSPSVCGADQGAVDIEALRTAAMRTYWADAFARRPSGPAAVVENRVDWTRIFADSRRGRTMRPTPRAEIAAVAAATTPAGHNDAAVVAEVSTVADLRATSSAAAADVRRTDAIAAGDEAVSAVEIDADAIAEFAASSADGAVSVADAVAAEPVDAASERDAPPVFDLDRAGWKLVNGVNRRINRSIRQTADSRLYGVEDFWTLPSAGRGDCEDFVLAKREALIAAGVPAEALSIAIVETRWGESHAVLLISSDRGEYVLDNLSPWVSRWDRVNYAWKERQLPGRPFDWVHAAS